MTELFLAALSGLHVWIMLRCLGPRCPVVAGRVAALTGYGEPGPGRRVVEPVLGLLSAVGRRFPNPRAAVRQAAAGSGPDGVAISSLSPEAIRGVQLALTGLGVAAGLSAGPLAPPLVPALGMTGYRLPAMVLRRRLKRRREDLTAALPDAVDLLAVCSHAGLNTALSLQRVAARTPGPLGEELERALKEIDLGMPRIRALQRLADRTAVAELEAMVAVLSNAERFGSRVSGSLEAFSSEIRSRKKRRAEEQARKAPVKILFPLVFLILPAFILLTVVPLLLSAFMSMGLG